MKKLSLLFSLILTSAVFAQIPSYYNDVNLTLNGSALKDELAIKIISTHTTNLSYTPGVVKSHHFLSNNNFHGC